MLTNRKFPLHLIEFSTFCREKKLLLYFNFYYNLIDLVFFIICISFFNLFNYLDI